MSGQRSGHCTTSSSLRICLSGYCLGGDRTNRPPSPFLLRRFSEPGKDNRGHVVAEAQPKKFVMPCLFLVSLCQVNDRGFCSFKAWTMHKIEKTSLSCRYVSQGTEHFSYSPFELLPRETQNQRAAVPAPGAPADSSLAPAELVRACWESISSCLPLHSSAARSMS